MHRAGKPSTEELLNAKPFRFDFFQATRLLSKIHPELAEVGHPHRPDDEVVRIKTYSSLAFPASQIYSLDRDVEGRHTMLVTFMGMTGLLGALPQHYTELLLDRRRSKDETLLDFLDLFNHRLISLFYRAWKKYRPYLAYETAELKGREALQRGEDKYRAFVVTQRPKIDFPAQIVLDLIGLGVPSLRYRAGLRQHLVGRTELADNTFRYYSGLLSQRHRSAIGLANILGDFLDLPVDIRQFQGQWLVLDVEDQTSLSEQGNNRLGITAIAGERVWNIESKFQVEIGPLNFSQFCDLIPIGTAHRAAGQMTRLYAGLQFDFDFRLKLLRSEVPMCQLVETDSVGPRLGWTTWLKNEGKQDDDLGCVSVTLHCDE